MGHQEVLSTERLTMSANSLILIPTRLVRKRVMLRRIRCWTA
jgi:hypothetical protein